MSTTTPRAAVRGRLQYQQICFRLSDKSEVASDSGPKDQIDGDYCGNRRLEREVSCGERSGISVSTDTWTQRS